MRRLAVALALTVACTELTGDFGDVVALELLVSRSLSLEEADTLRLAARALDIDGNPLPEAQVVWRVVSPDTGAGIGFELDSLSGLVTGRFPGAWDVRGRVENLPTDRITITVTGAPDTLLTEIDTALTVALGTPQSANLLVRLLDRTTSPGSDLPAAGKTVSFQITFPVGATGVALTAGAGDPGPDPLAGTALTASDGRAFLNVRRIGAPQPDSVIVTASARTVVGATVPGTPVVFVVHFAN